MPRRAEKKIWALCMAIQYCNLLGNTVFVPNSKDTFIYSGLFTVHRGMGHKQRGSWKSKRKNSMHFHSIAVIYEYFTRMWGAIGLVRGPETRANNWLWLQFTCQCKRCKRCGLDPWVEKISRSRKRQPSPVFSPGKSHGQKSLVGYSPWGHKDSDMTEPLSAPRPL